MDEEDGIRVLHDGVFRSGWALWDDWDRQWAMDGMGIRGGTEEVSKGA